MNEPGYHAPDLSLVGSAHVARYRETAGAVGHEWNGAKVLLLTTTGRKTGKRRTSALIYGRDGDDYLVVASAGGAAEHPAWYLNLRTHPQAEIQVMAERLRVTARVATERERTRLWDIAIGYWPNYDVYQTRTGRMIPLVVLTPS
ncbi:nitroreductase family deazaflavin-dependent oxidoreductase [Nocardia goodfellowii]